MELIHSQMGPLGSFRIFTIHVDGSNFPLSLLRRIASFFGTVLIPSTTGERTASLGPCAGLKKVTGCLPRKRQENLRIKSSKTTNCSSGTLGNTCWSWSSCYLPHLVWDRAHSRKQRPSEHAVIRIAWIAWGDSNYLRCSVYFLSFRYTWQLNKLYTPKIDIGYLEWIMNSRRLCMNAFIEIRPVGAKAVTRSTLAKGARPFYAEKTHGRFKNAAIYGIFGPFWSPGFSWVRIYVVMAQRFERSAHFKHILASCTIWSPSELPQNIAGNKKKLGADHGPEK